jgi:hypothetical protein
MENIENKVANSGLITLNPEELILDFPFKTIDIKEQLYMGLMLKEKDFRDYIKTNDWLIYKDCYVNIICSSDAIVPTWAYMLIATKLQAVVKYAMVGTREELEHQLYINAIEQLETDEYLDKRIVIKGCGDKFIPNNVYLKLTDKLLPIVKSLMFGEPCSTVPVYKKS